MKYLISIVVLLVITAATQAQCASGSCGTTVVRGRMIVHQAPPTVVLMVQPKTIPQAPALKTAPMVVAPTSQTTTVIQQRGIFGRKVRMIQISQ